MTDRDVVEEGSAGKDGATPTDGGTDGPGDSGASLDGGLVLTRVPLAAGAHPWGITQGADGRIWFTESGTGTGAEGTGKIGAFNPSTPTLITYYASNLPSTSIPWGITAGPDQNLWFTDRGSGQIGQIMLPTGSISEFAGVTTGGEPWSIATGPSTPTGLVFTELAGDRIGFSSTSGHISEMPLAAGSGPWGIAVYATGGAEGTQTLCYTASGEHVSGCFTNGTGNPPAFYPSGGAAPSAPYGMTQGPDGALWIADFGESVIATFTPGPGSVPVTIPTPTTNAGPYMITPGASIGGIGAAGSVTGRLWFTEYSAGQIGRIDLIDGADPELDERAIGSDAEPAGIVVDTAGDVWFTAYGGDFIGELRAPGAMPL